MNITSRQMLRRLTVLLTLTLLLVITACAQRTVVSQSSTNVASQIDATEGVLWSDIPEKIDVKARYLFYLHGAIVENEGIRPVSPQYGVYEYEKILETFVNKKFIVISERRPRGTDPRQYAAKVVNQVNRLLKAGIAPQRITIVGASRGGAITMLVSTLLKNKNVNFVILASCGNSSVYSNTKIDLWGNILSIYDDKDVTGAGTCQKFFDTSTGLNKRQEIMLQLGLGHGILYRPLKEWVEPTIAWANQQ